MQRNWAYGVGVSFVALFLFVLRSYYATAPADLPPYAETIAPTGASQPTEFLFCHWNVENFFDDQFDGRTGPGDKEYDGLFSNNPELLKQKLRKLTEAILKMNGGKGPDILALVEVESVRAAELLQKSLNDQLRDDALRYQNLLMVEIKGGRHISPAILTRLPVVKDRTRTHGNRQRILEGRVVVNRHELIIFASHWTSRVKETGDKGRHDYANKLYGAGNAIFLSNPAADFLIAGDFNDDPNDETVVQNLRATGNMQAVRDSRDALKLFNLMAGKDPKTFGTHFYRTWHIFDQIVVAPGLLDNKGWSCNVDSVHVVNDLHRANDPQKRPWRFGGTKEKGERGYSDHFPVTVRLRVER